MEDKVFGVIYKIINLVTIDFYIGSTINFKQRKQRHFKDLNRNIHHARYMQRSFNKYGVDNFTIEIIENVYDCNALLEREQFYLDTLNPKYNQSKRAGNNLGFKHSEETKKRNSIRNRGGLNGNAKIKDADVIFIRGLYISGKSAALIHKKYYPNVNITSITRALFGQTFKHLGPGVTPNVNRTHSEETKAKISRKARAREKTARGIFIAQYSLLGEFISIYRSITKAHESTRVDREKITAQLFGVSTKHDKYIFRFLNDSDSDKLTGKTVDKIKLIAGR